MAKKTNIKSYILTRSVCFSIGLFLLSLSLPAQIVDNTGPQDKYYMRKQRVTNFWDMKDFRDVFYVDKYLMGRKRFSGHLAYNWQRVLIAEFPELHYEYRSALSFMLKYRIFEEISFDTDFYFDFNKAAAARWISDFTYSIARRNWRSNKINFGYENYQDNQYTDNLDRLAQKFMEGYYFVSYNLPIPDSLSKKMRIDSTTNYKVSVFGRFGFRYRDQNEKIHYEGKPVAGINARVTLFWNIYVEGGLYYYFTPKFRQLPWDPDYTYGFGYFDYRAFRISITYGNWAVNRFPGKATYYPHYGFLDGNFKVMINWEW
jgi:hypothetical protein